SATMSKDIERIARTYLHDHKEIVVGSRNEGAENVNHIYYMVQARDKYLALKRIVDYYPRIFAIVFCRTKAETQEVADKLIRDGYSAESLHGDLSQQQRDLTMQKFRQHLTQLLVATDVAARGLDVDDLTHVINFGLPDDIENYTHRSGRTGRAGKKGTSIAIVHSRERHKIRNIEREIGKKFVEGTIPSSKEICTKQLYKVMEQIDKVDVKEEEIAPFMEDINRRFDYMDKEELLKKIVSMEFGKFLAYYADAPEISQISAKDDKKKSASDKPKGKGGGARKAEKGYVKLFINLGKTDGFYPGEIMQFINKHVGGRQRVGHIDLLQRFSYIEVPERDARKVMDALDGTTYKKRAVRCNRSDETDPSKREKRGDRKEKPARRDNKGKKKEKKQRNEMPKEENNYDWRQFFRNDDIKLKGEEPDFSEDGWARRKPKKK
ncbi:MAG: DEAD/DEAH box helicase, partial [Prevotella sp.]|nr:DEAD/DEAH box helicase [Prevotella sp.]